MIFIEGFGLADLAGEANDERTRFRLGSISKSFTAALDDLIGVFSGEKLEFPPGSRFSYSNSGFVLCAKIIEIATGRPYADYIEEAILRPAGMSRSGARHESGSAREAWDIGCHFTGDGYAPTPHWDSSKAVGAGSIYSTARTMEAASSVSGAI